MIFRNQVTHPTQLSTNPLLNHQRKTKYKAHLNKIFQIESREYKPKEEAKLVERKVTSLTRLKGLARGFKEREESEKRFRNDLIMVTHMRQIQQTRNYPENQSRNSLHHTTITTNTHSHLRKTTRSTTTFHLPLTLTSTCSIKNLKAPLIQQEVKKQNQHLIRSISQNSFNEERFRRTLKESTRDYLKVREHMRRVKGDGEGQEPRREKKRSVKRLKTEPERVATMHETCCFREQPKDILTANVRSTVGTGKRMINCSNQEEEQLEGQLCHKSTTNHPQHNFMIIGGDNHKKKSFPIKKTKRMFTTMNQSLTEVIERKLRLILKEEQA